MCNKKGDEENMQALEKKFPELKLDTKKLWAKAEKLKSNKDGIILLNRTNPEHRDWFNDDSN
ncbi:MULTISPECIES: hypothetical protein [Bacillus]|uniref:Uncharacterized protein n=2 Tax=Bacillus glycinifermentans TaxID=1664069 RepID=A0A0T6BI69_9BACI|nr:MULTISPECIES: hypothetical protein [Bacillus]KRT87128.1 hypothetical protein AB447_209170 [Bacillus glycinifermentans]MEC0341982.1 hypothetical protein [Bacillus sonorensis]MEC0530702.1 hypothetical protein [Bacillus sonorensis]UBF35313.1 hypothetical protein K9N56_23500 [Bacillus sp. PM8313]